MELRLLGWPGSVEKPLAGYLENGGHRHPMNQGGILTTHLATPPNLASSRTAMWDEAAQVPLSE
jgi:hypothetical protein